MKDYQKKIADSLGDDIIKFARFALESSNADMLRACVDCYFKIYERSLSSAMLSASSLEAE